MKRRQRGFPRCLFSSHTIVTDARIGDRESQQMPVENLSKGGIDGAWTNPNHMLV